jgi:P-type Cu2+ transporter
VDGAFAAIAGFGDPIRPDAARSLERLAKLGYELSILSGDHQAVVSAVARRLGVRFEFARGETSPEQKLALIEELGRSRTVVMIGDGVNDAAALAAAGVGVAVHGGAEASLAAADVFLTRPGLAPIMDLVLGARRSLGAIRRGLVFSLLYNAVGVGLALTGVLTPLWAAVLMPLSSLTVLTSALRARTFSRGTEP